VTATAAPQLPEVPELPRRRRAPSTGIIGGLVGRARAGIVTTGQLVTLAVDASVFIATDIARRRFSWSEFLLQAWFMTRVSLRTPSSSAAARPTLGRRWVSVVLRRPVIALVGAVAVLGIAAVPMFDLRLGLPDDGMAAADSSPRLAYDLLAEGFGSGYNGPLTVVVDGPDVDTVMATVSDLPGVASVSPARTSETGTVSIFSVVPTTGPNDPATTDLVHAIRAATSDAPGGDVSVTGLTAVNIDASATISSSLLPYLALIVGLAFLLLIVVFRSVLVPIKATLGFLLTIGATFGVMVAVFQWGWLNGLLGVSATGPIASMMPIFIIGIVFGLAMDYEVFLVTRMREAYVVAQVRTTPSSKGSRPAPGW
jgi:RND superfamily putative drug exporter